MNLFSIIDMGRRSLQTQQNGITVTNNNIANVNTPGYSRQRAEITSTEPRGSMGIDGMGRTGQFGTGSEVSFITRIRDKFLDRHVRDATEDLAEWQAKEQGLGMVEEIFMELSEQALNNDIQDFWNSWQLLSHDPLNSIHRNEVINRANDITDTLKQVNNDLTALRREIDDTIFLDVQKVNELASRIAQLNEEIMQVEAQGVQANDLRDQRDVLIDELSEIVNIQVQEQGTGEVYVDIDGRHLVVGIEAERLDMVTNIKTVNGIDYPIEDIVWAYDGTSAIIEGGKMGGILEVRDQIIPKFIQELDAFTSSFITTVNTQHQAGFYYDSVSGTMTGGTAFFSGTDATDIAVTVNASQIAASGSVAADRADNANAIAMGQLRDPVNASYLDLVSDYGQESKNAIDMVQTKSSVLSNLEGRRAEISGVSLDEEMAKMIQYQHAYQAAARMITTVDEMISTVINRMGLSGR